jgi:hypothetical protein
MRNKLSVATTYFSSVPRAHPTFRSPSRPEATPYPHMESQRPDSNLGVQLQLEEALGHRWTVLVELLLSSLHRCDQDRTGDRFLETPSTPREGQVAYRLGWRGHPPQSIRVSVSKRSAR